MRRLTVVSVAYPFAPVGPDAVGGAEQVLTAIDEALVRDGHRSVVVACEGSRCWGEQVVVPWSGGAVDAGVRASTHAWLRARLERLVHDLHPDVVHVHGVDFDGYLPGEGVPVLVTLHLPLAEYPVRALVPNRRGTVYNGVSASQMRGAPDGMPSAGVIDNGVPLDRFEPTSVPGRYAMAIGRICPEKGFDAALDAARFASMPVVLAGKAFPYEAHERYFRECLAPRFFRAGCHFVGPVARARKRRLLARARCLVVPSRIAETSSLVAMEALASGTPVVATRAGALPDIVDHGRTGLLVDVDDIAAMARAIRDASALDRRACRLAAETRFDAAHTTRKYLDVYRRLSGRSAREHAACWP